TFFHLLYSAYATSTTEIYTLSLHDALPICGFLNGDLGIKHIDSKMPANSSGQVVSYEYIAKKNPDKIFYINRTDKETKGIPQELKNPVIKNVNAIKNNDILEFDANTWFFGAGGINSTIKQLDDIEKAYK